MNLIFFITALFTSPSPDIVITGHFVDVKVSKTGASTTVERKTWQILSDDGIKHLITHRFDYDPSTNRIKILSISRIRPGNKKTPLKCSEVDLPQSAGWILWRFWMKIVTCPALETGDSLEIVTEKKGFMIAYLRRDEEFIPPMKGHFYDQVLFGDEQWPVNFKKYTVTVPDNMRLRASVYNGSINSSINYKEKNTVYSWWRGGLKAHKREKGSPSESDYLPKVVMATVHNWEEKSRWFYEVNKNQFEPTPEIKAMVSKIIKGVTDKKRQMALLNRWVAGNIRYRGWSNGKHEGYTLHSGEQVFNQRAGVCKDIASMLITMLKAAGFEVYPAMTMAGARVENIPADQFNHSVVAVKMPDGSFHMLDPTWAPFSRHDWSYAEREQYYVIGTPRGETLMKIPASRPEENTLSLKAVSKISADYASSWTLRGSGYADDSLRRMIAFTSIPERAMIPELFVRNLQGATVSSTGYLNPGNLDREMSMNLRWSSKNLVIQIPGGLIFTPSSLKALPERVAVLSWLNIKDKKRKSPILLRANHVLEIEEDIVFPSAFDLKTEKLSGSYESNHFKMNWVYSVQGKILKIKVKVVVPHRTIPSSSFSDFMKGVSMLRKLSSEKLVVKFKK